MAFQLKGIDVSKYQGTIDWNKVKNAGIKFAMLRCTVGGTNGGTDTKFIQNADGCEAAGMDYGVYCYSKAVTIEQAKNEATMTLNAIKGRKLAFPVAFDIEDASQAKLTKEQVTSIIEAFCETIENAGYYAIIYANKNWLETRMIADRIAKYDVWCAQWGKACTYKGSYGIWQYTSYGTVDGISGRVDMNICYKNYPDIMSMTGLNGYNQSPATPTTPSKPALKPITEVANEVIAGKWGNGTDRKNRLTAAGYDYDAVQNEVNKILYTPKLKPIEEVAKEVIRGDWGNGAERKTKLEKAGYNYSEVQAMVNKLL